MTFYSETSPEQPTSTAKAPSSMFNQAYKYTWKSAKKLWKKSKSGNTPTTPANPADSMPTHLCVTTNPVAVAAFPSHYQNMAADSNYLFSDEFDGAHPYPAK